MSKGGQAKVYFVLYLAIVVELLIIIVERDEAEEHLHKQNNETMKIVESILSQLYSGSGSEGINTKPQDEITLPAEADMAAVKEIFGGELKTWRQYQIDVGVTDVTLAIKKKEGETSKEYDERVKNMLSLANVEDLEYQIFFIPAQTADTMPAFQPDDYIQKNNVDFMKFETGQSFAGPNGEPWVFVGAYRLSFDKETSYSRLNTKELYTTLDFAPVYKPLMRVGNGSAPRGREDSCFFYSDIKTRETANISKNVQKRSFLVGFEPTDRSKAGIYKLRFASKTNRILGVAILDEGIRQVSDEESKVNIGTVQLTVKDLKKVAKELKRKHPELDKVPSIDELSTAKGDDFSKKIAEFNAGIEEAKKLAMESKDAADLVGKVRLYEYVARLVTPGQSVNFDQNRSNFDINVRVQTAKPSTAKPYVSMLTDNRCFSEAQHVFEIEAGPYKANNRITGRVMGPTTADISFSVDGATPERDKKYRLRGTVNRKLPAGKYVMEITHEISGKSEVTRDTLYVYDAGIKDEGRSRDRLARRMKYGSKLTFDLLPNSENNIASANFKTVITFDGGNKKEVNGYKVTRDANVECLATFNKCAVALVWIQPVTYQELTLFRTEADIALDEPAILPDVSVKYSGNASKIKVEAKGLMVYAPSTGSADKNLKIQMGEPLLKESNAEVNGYSISKQPEIVGGDAENGYIIEFELSKNSGANVKSAEGAVSIPVIVTAKHPTNGKTSKSETEVIVNIDYTPSAKAPVGRPGTPAKPPTKAPVPKKK